VIAVPAAEPRGTTTMKVRPSAPVVTTLGGSLPRSHRTTPGEKFLPSATTPGIIAPKTKKP